MQIPDFSQTATPKATRVCKTRDRKLLSGELQDSQLAPLKPLPLLAMLVIADSVFLRRFYRLFFSLFTVGLIIALGPYIGDGRSAVITRLGWFCLLVIAFIGLWGVYRRQDAAIPVGYLACDHGVWMLGEGNRSTRYILAGEVLCWPLLIILPLKSNAGYKRLLVIGCDALTLADQARLRTWLRACLKPKA